MSRYGFLIDMDGVIYRGSETIPGAVEFVNDLVKSDVPFVFVTNNSQRTPRDIVEKLVRLGFNVEATFSLKQAEELPNSKTMTGVDFQLAALAFLEVIGEVGIQCFLELGKSWS